jgi:hypothetical protein
MRGLATTSLLLLMLFQLARIQAQELQLTFENEDTQKFTLSIVNPVASNGHTFIEFSMNGVWSPAYFASSNSPSSLIYTVTNTGGIRLFRAVQDPTIANQVKASWERLGVTNYVFRYSRECICGSMVSGTVTVIADEVVKVEDARNVFGEPIADPPLSHATTINRILEAWLSSEPSGGHARELVFDINGFPQSINIDLDPRLADEELIYRIHSFTPLP